jgi:hypothetical protein
MAFSTMWTPTTIMMAFEIDLTTTSVALDPDRSCMEYDETNSYHPHAGRP